jgi:hypothetical protein
VLFPETARWARDHHQVVVKSDSPIATVTAVQLDKLGNLTCAGSGTSGSDRYPVTLEHLADKVAVQNLDQVAVIQVIDPF